jgi:hypothetical protein
VLYKSKMRDKLFNTRTAFRITFLIMAVVSLLISSCSSRKNRLDRKNLIPEKELINLLVDIYIADGLLVLPHIDAWSSKLDSITAYYHIIEKHGFTRENLDKTMKYYFIKDPKTLNKIYDQVLGILSEMESRYEKEFTTEQTRISNLWPGKAFYSIPSVSGKDSTMFDISATMTGAYILSFSATVFPDDQSVNPRAIAYTCSPDSIESVRRNYFKSIEFVKDGMPHYYSMKIFVPSRVPAHIRGWLYYFENQSPSVEKNIYIGDISISYTIGIL